MFHAARAWYTVGFQRKKPLRLLIALRELFGNQLEAKTIRNFEEAMDLREEADYGLLFSEE